ncbi:MAG: DUF4350 domain-containing protein [Gammaproteobacteria bacterium]|nr:DUF4350 domain-containing protein [Gammaproteobacteria bacterium]
MSRRTAWLLLILVLGIVAWFAFRWEWVEKSIDLGFDTEALGNPYLAAGQFLREQGVDVIAEPGWDILDRARDETDALSSGVLIVPASRRSLSERRQTQLWRWVENGGSLITQAQGFSDPETGYSGDAILNRLGLQLYPAEAGETREKFDPARPWLQRATHFDSDRCGAEKNVVKLEFTDQPELLQALFAPGLVLVDEEQAATSWASNNDGIQFIRVEVGKGQVIVTTDISLWSNAKIGCYDHAFLLWLLVRDDAQVGFLFNAEVDSLWTLLWKYAPFSAGFGLIWILLWWWNRAARFAPLLPGFFPARRELGEHLYASAMFVWRNGEVASLYRPLQKNVFRETAERHPTFDNMNGDEQSAFLAKITGLDQKKVQWALHCRECEKRSTFLRLVGILQLIRNRL